MPLGSFRLTTLSAVSGTIPESYHFMYSSEFLYADAIQVDATGNQFIGTIGDTKFVKITPTGSIAWAKQITGGLAAESNSTKIVLDTNDNLIFAGGDNNLDSKSTLLSLSNSSGSQNWATHRASTSYRRNLGVVMLSDGSFVTAGYGNANGHVLYTKYNSSGAYTSQYSQATIGSLGRQQIVRDASNNVYTLWQNSSTNARVITKLNSSLAVQWHRTINGTGWFGSIHLTCDSSGNVYVANGTKIIKIDTSGTKVWERDSTQNLTQRGVAMTVDADSNLYVTGDDGEGVYAYVKKINSSGTLQWYRKITTNGGGVQLTGITVKGSNLYLCGTATINSSASSFIMKVPTDGTKTGSYSSGLFSYTSHTATLSSGSDMSIQTVSYSNGTAATSSTTYSMTYSDISLSSLTKTVL
jgi:hypothetical protein